MKLKITEKGVFDEESNEVEVGTTVDVDGDEIPSFLKGKVAVVEGGEAKAEAPAADPAERAELMVQAVQHLKDEDFTKSGLPEVKALNAILEDAEGDFAQFTTKERNDLWEQVKDRVENGGE